MREDIYKNYHISITSPFPEITQIGTSQALTYGNKVIADGATASDLEYYSAYPMTPASSILTEIIK